MRGLSAQTVRENLEQVHERIAQAAKRAGRNAEEVQILAATKYVAEQDMPILHEGGIRLVGENRAQDLIQKHASHGELFTWDFIGQLQSRKVRTILPYVRMIHSVASDSAMREIARHHELGCPDLKVLVEVNVSGEAGKAGVSPEELRAFLDRAPVVVCGLMGMPPLATDPRDSRRWFAALRDLAAQNDLEQLSMGTTQDYEVAVEEGATIVRIGTKLYA